MNIVPKRPTALHDFVGQNELTTRLRTIMQGSMARGAKPPHVLLSGPPGTGKTTLAQVVAHELDAHLITTTGPALRNAGDLAGVLFAGEGSEGLTVVFVDEIHRLPAMVEESLYEALEDGTLTVVTGSGSDARSIKHTLPPLVFVAATTKPGSLSQPLRDRFGFHGTLAPYTPDELAFIVGRQWTRNAFEFTMEAALTVANRSKGTPRVALHLADRVLDVAAPTGRTVTGPAAAAALDAFGIGERGLDETDWRIITALCVTFRGRAVGLDALAQFLNLDRATIEREYEGPLVRAGYVIRTANGRMAGAPAYDLMDGARA